MRSNNNAMDYSVLMPVYKNEKPEFLKEAFESIWNQTVKTNDFVLVCDGPLTAELEQVILEEKSKHDDILHVIKLEENKGISVALNVGLKNCKNEWVGRMDSDDISLPYRFEKQICCIKNNPSISICGAAIEEFGIYKTRNKRILPFGHNEIVALSKKRCPFNHPTIMYKKADVLKVGGYENSLIAFEDYPLWIKMLKNGSKAVNCQDVLLKTRVSSDFYERRGGYKYAKNMLKFRCWMLKIGWINTIDFISSAIPHFFVCMLPNKIRKNIYFFIRTK